jgi:broad specificity phosphatase PhoE
MAGGPAKVTLWAPQGLREGSVPLAHCVILVRHGRTGLNAERRLRGHLDPPLDDAGRREVRDLAAVFASTRPRRILTSPLARAVQTAEAIGVRTGLRVVVDQRLIDRDYGEWAGQLEEEVVARWGSLDAAPGAEPAGDVAARARAALDEVLDPDQPAPVVLVAHDAVNRLLLAHLDPQLGPAAGIGQRTACWNVLRREQARWRVELVDAKAPGGVPSRPA